MEEGMTELRDELGSNPTVSTIAATVARKNYTGAHSFRAKYSKQLSQPIFPSTMDKNQMPPPGFMPPPAYGPPPQAQPSVMIVQAPALGPESVSMTCPHCRANISTRVEQSSSTKTHIIALLLCIFGCWPCAPCPYCIDSCLSKKHYCPGCNAYIGEYSN
ncbi:lipopolysaccharide-induced tumor necrosis factor-alpha factor homolog isoform X1 [Neodiprion pinetum]|uniref:Lipopolysaccharide-induced tumor necrosis factor-alpha factor homolog isoform X1 n=2 Tax=Neodiprion lecontei TaxID=441921 RepID=A0A6J0B2P0_NEOLC|nr:lipopolysaccharide-induced tumor necrosis factor-alpha factor homolog isoform X1 [Neodiprion lecontei]XP_046466014.1 lipopolysaccharide-induced tumor necrosis factor-alpha factor homolog isoform X1 [Neodiprion pinetum]